MLGAWCYLGRLGGQNQRIIQDQVGTESDQEDSWDIKDLPMGFGYF